MMGPSFDERLRGVSDRLKERVGRPLFDADEESGLQAMLRRGPLNSGVGKGALIPRRLRMFPFTSPTWPTSIPREPERSELGTNYDTEWARDPWAIAIRRVLTNGVMRPGVELLASPTVHGEDRLDGVDGPVIFTPNHLSHMDTFLLLSTLPARFRKKVVVAAGADYFFDTRVKAVLSALAISAIPIERKKVSRSSSDLALKMIADGWNLIIFPEGSRSPDGWASEFKPGAAFLSTRTKAPVIPVHLEGTNRVLPKGSNVPKRGSTTVTFGLPLAPLTDEDPRAMNRRIETSVAELADEEANGWWQARLNASAGITPKLQGPTLSTWRKEWLRTEQERRHNKPKRSWP
jgi:1-acyl-sn-glycerol-3-phosphate acyltransferase